MDVPYIKYIYIYNSHTAVPFMWGSLRLTPIILFVGQKSNFISKHLIKPAQVPGTPRSRPTDERAGGARVLTSADCLTMLKEKEEKKRKDVKKKEQRKVERKQKEPMFRRVEKKKAEEKARQITAKKQVTTAAVCKAKSYCTNSMEYVFVR